MKPHPFYTNTNCTTPAYSLRYSWSGWLNENSPEIPASYDIDDKLKNRWESDGLRLLESDITSRQSRLLFSAKPHLSAVDIARLAKGRLQYAIRQQNKGIRFSRKLSFRSLNNNRTEDVCAYIGMQVSKERFVDPKYSARLEEFTCVDPNLQFSTPTASRSGRYWYDLHFVFRIAKGELLRTNHHMPLIRNALPRIAAKHDHRVGAYSIMPDHLHMALRGNISWSPEEIAFNFMNNLAHVCKGSIWQNGFYAGTFGEYSVKVIKRMIG